MASVGRDNLTDWPSFLPYLPYRTVLLPYDLLYTYRPSFCTVPTVLTTTVTTYLLLSVLTFCTVPYQSIPSSSVPDHSSPFIVQIQGHILWPISQSHIHITWEHRLHIIPVYP